MVIVRDEPGSRVPSRVVDHHAVVDLKGRGDETTPITGAMQVD